MSTTRFSRLPTKIAFPGYIVAPNGGQVIYLCSLGVQDGFQDDIASVLYTTLSAALNVCRANRGDVIVALPGHTESVTTTPTFKAGVTVLGIGNGDERPTFNWTAATSQWAVTVNNVRFENCVLNLAATAATATTKAIVATGTSFQLVNNRIIMGASSTQQATIGIEYGTGADNALFDSNDVFATSDSAVVSCLKIVAAIKKFRMVNNIMEVGMSATTAGLVTMTTAPVDVFIDSNSISNTITSSTKALVGITAATGQVSNNMLYITNATGGATAIGTLGSLGFAQNFGCATNGSALLTPAAGG